jgi:NADPH-dependent 2,4-dienoyl-CoA reductase/sulfur reductase-like enzyme
LVPNRTIFKAIGSALAWLQAPLPSHRLIIIEQKSHFHYIYAFPRAAVKSGFEDSLFVPYDGLFGQDKNIGEVVQAKAIAIQRSKVILDREVNGFGSSVPFTHLIYAAGTTIPAPGHFEAYDKSKGMACLHLYQGLICQSKKPVIIGGGAVGLGKCHPFMMTSCICTVSNHILRICRTGCRD